MPDVHLRRYATRDAAAVYEAVRESMSELLPWMPWCHPEYSMAESRNWLEAQVAAFDQGGAFEFAIVSAGDDYLGGVGLNQIDSANQRANLGYWVRSSATGRGVATTAVRLMREWAFDSTQLQRLEIVIAVENAPSQRVAEKAGAVREGVLRQRLLLRGAPHDAAVLSFVRRDDLR